MTEVSSSAYPQMVEAAGASVAAPSASLKGPLAGMDGEQVLFKRAVRVLETEVCGNTVRILCETRGSLNRTVFTHETSMHQFAEGEESGLLHVEIVFWSPSIFRVRFSEQPLPVEEPAFPPPSARMLCGAPRADITLQVSDTPEILEVSTGALCLRIAKKPFGLQRCHA